MSNMRAAGGVPAPLDPTELAKLAGRPPFGQFRAEIRDDLMALATAHDLPAGAWLFRRDDPTEAIYPVLTGLVGLSVPGRHGRSTLVEMAGPGTLLGETSLVGSSGHDMSARAIRSSRLARLPADAVLVALRRDGQARLAWLAGMSARLRGLAQQVSELKLRTGPQRLAAFLAGLAGAAGRQATIEPGFEKRVIAEFLGATPESLSRGLQMLENADLIRRDGQSLVLLDIPALRHFSRGED